MDSYFPPWVQFQANVVFPLYIPNSGNEVGKVIVTETELKTMRAARLASHSKHLPDIHPAELLQTVKVLGCQIIGSRPMSHLSILLTPGCVTHRWLLLSGIFHL